MAYLHFAPMTRSSHPRIFVSYLHFLNFDYLLLHFPWDGFKDSIIKAKITKAKTSPQPSDACTGNLLEVKVDPSWIRM